MLVALGAAVELATAARPAPHVPIAEFFIGPKRTALAPGRAHRRACTCRCGAAAQEYLKVGVRNAMVIAVASLAIVVDRDDRRVGVGLGSVGPTPLRAPEAEAWARRAVDWDDGRARPDDPRAFGRLVAAAARPIDDHRSTADYRRHAVGVLAPAAALARMLGAERRP